MSGYLFSGVLVPSLSVHLDDSLTRAFSIGYWPCDHTKSQTIQIPIDRWARVINSMKRRWYGMVLSRPCRSQTVVWIEETEWHDRCHG